MGGGIFTKLTPGRLDNLFWPDLNLMALSNFNCHKISTVVQQRDVRAEIFTVMYPRIFACKAKLHCTYLRIFVQLILNKHL